MHAIPTLQALLAKHMELALSSPELPTSEVEPYQAAVPVWSHPNALWLDALRSAALLLPADQCETWGGAKLPMDAAWAQALSGCVTSGAVPFCLGHVPQMLNDMTPLLTKGRSVLHPPSARPDAGPAPEPLSDRATRETKFLRQAVLRMTGHYAAAQSILQDLAGSSGVEFVSLLQNETAALHWQRGDCAAAIALWKGLVKTPVGAFNLGLAALCNGEVSDARQHLASAANALPETEPWHHLAQLYRTLAE